MKKPGKTRKERPEIAKQPEEMQLSMECFKKPFETAKALFNYKKIDEAVKDALPYANLRDAIVLFFFVAVFAGISSIILNAEFLYLQQFTYETLTEAGVETEPALDIDLGKVTAFIIVFSIPFSFILSLIYEAVAYYAFRLTGGKGSLARQFYISAIISSAAIAAFSVGLLVGVPILMYLPCLGLLVLAVWFILMVYFMLFVRIKGYAGVHEISLLHSLLVVLAVYLISLLALTLLSPINDLAMEFFQLPPSNNTMV